MLQRRNGFKKKKFLVSISLFLTLMMLIGSISPVYATDGEGQQEETTLVDSQNTPTPTEEGALDDGEYFVEGEDEIDGDVYITVDTADPTAEPEVTPEITPEVTPEVTPEITPEVTEEPVQEVVEEEKASEDEFEVLDFDFDDELDAVALARPICGKEYHEHGEECFDEFGTLVCEIEEHVHVDEPGNSCYLEAQEIEQPAPGRRLLKAPSSSQATHEIGRSWMVTMNENPREHTYVSIAGTKYDLVRDGTTTRFEPALEGTIPTNTRVRLSIVFEVRDKGVGKGLPVPPLLMYRLPSDLSWDNKSGMIVDANNINVPAGTYRIQDNVVYIQYSRDFWNNNSKIDTRINVDGHVIETEDGKSGEQVYEFNDMGELGPVKIENVNALDLDKHVANDMPNYLVIDDVNNTVTVTYVIEIRTVGDGGIKNFEIKDILEANGELNAHLVGDLKFGTEPGLDNRGPTSENNIIYDYTKGTDNFKFKVREWDSKDQGSALYVTYQVQFTPKRFGLDTSGNKTDYVFVGNKVESTYEDGNPGPKTNDDFIYKNGLVSKTGVGSKTESYVADWNATFNDYAPLIGATFGAPDNMTLIKDTLGENHVPYNPEGDWSNVTISMYEPNDTKTAYKPEVKIETPEQFAQFKKADGTPIIDKNDFMTEYFSNGVQVPITNKYIIKYQSRLRQDLIDNLDTLGDISEQKVKNAASNDGSDVSGDPVTEEKEVGVGPAKPQITKTYDKDASTSSKAAWKVTLEIKDEKLQTTDYIYDYISKSHTIDDGTPITFTITKKEGTGETTLFTQDVPWSNANITLNNKSWIDNGEEKPKKPDGTDPNKEVYNDQFQENFKVNIPGLINEYVDPSEKSTYLEVKEGKNILKKDYKFNITYYTDLVTSEEALEEQSPVSNTFTYTNNAFAVVDKDKSVIEDSKNTTRNIIIKADLDNSKALYEAATGKSIDDLSFQQIPWYISVLVLKSDLVLSDAYHTDQAGYGTMSLKKDSLVIYQTNKADKDTGSVERINWNTDATKLQEGKDYTLVVNKTDGVESGFEIHFNNLSTEDNSRVVIFYVTEAGDEYDNKVRLVYANTVKPNYGSGGSQPSASDNTSRFYNILDKNAQYDDTADNPLIALYTIDINKSAMDLDDGNTLDIVDELKQYLIYVAGTFQFFEVTEDSQGNPIYIEKAPGTDGYSVDASEANKLKIKVPDEKWIQIRYYAQVNYPAIAGENVNAINEITLKGKKTFTDSNSIAVRVVDHEAIARGTTIKIRIYKFDKDNPTEALPNTTFKISAYHVPHPDDPNRRLYFDEAAENNPFTGVTDENGELVFQGHYDTVYKIEEIISPDGYALKPDFEYFCFVGFKDVEDFLGYKDENGKEINPYIHLVSEVNEARVTIGNRKENTALRLRKLDPNGKVLTGAVFNLRRADGTLVYENVEVDQNGEVEFAYLERGTYYIEEVKAPKGYTPYSQRVEFTYNGQTTYQFKHTYFIQYIPSRSPNTPNILNYKNGLRPPVPNTSDQTDIGMWSILLAGSFLLTILLVWLLNQDNKQLD